MLFIPSRSARITGLQCMAALIIGVLVDGVSGSGVVGSGMKPHLGRYNGARQEEVQERVQETTPRARLQEEQKMVLREGTVTALRGGAMSATVKFDGFPDEATLVVEGKKLLAKDPEALFDAAWKGDVPKIHQIIAAGGNVNVKNSNGDTPLHISAVRGNDAAIKVVETLLAAKADVNAKNRIGDTPLHFAADFFYGHGWTRETLIKALVAAGGNVNNNNGDTPLNIAAMHGRGVRIQALLADVDAKDRNGDTPLNIAAAEYYGVTMVETLLAAEADVNAKNEMGDTPLHIATDCFYGHFMPREALVKALVAAKADGNVKDDDGDTPLHLAAVCSRGAEIKALLAAKADVNAKDRIGDTPLHIAAMMMGPWCDDVEAAALEVVETLLVAEADVNAKDRNGNTPLHIAANVFRGDGRSKTALIKALVAAKAVVNVKNNAGKTPLHLAVDNNETSSAQVLRELGATE